MLAGFTKEVIRDVEVRWREEVERELEGKKKERERRG